jgi:hypothetical protein
MLLIRWQTESEDLSQVGRACCGGRQSCLDQNYKQRQYYVLTIDLQIGIVV